MISKVGLTRIATLFIVALLSACGGGGGGAAPPPASPPATPTLSAVAKDGYVDLSWTAVSGATGYNLYWSNTAGVTKANGTKISVQTGARTGALNGTDSGLVNGRTYFYIFSATNAGGESTASPEVSATPANGAGSNDPIYAAQWHLKNTAQTNVDGSPGGTAGEDINIELAWAACGTAATCRGEGVRVAVVDAGFEIAHEDLQANIATELSHNYVDGSTDPTSADATAFHGTAVAGLIAARDMNNLGVRGVAPRANLVAYNFLDNGTSANKVDAMTRNATNVSVSNNSWGPADNGLLAPAEQAWRDAINTGLTLGRGGRGIIYLFAAGNGGCPIGSPPGACDNSNYDEQANYRGVMAVAAVNDKGVKSSYSERGANLWVSAPGGEFCSTHAISTADRTGNAGANTSTSPNIDYLDRNYTQCMNGTSSATPITSGAVALMLQANPNLGWRDVRWIFAETARPNDPTNTEWVLNGANPRFYVNQNYGFGVVDAAAAVAAAKTWTNLPAEKTFSPTAKTALAKPIPDNNATGMTDTIAVTGSGISKIEYVEITFTAPNNSTNDNAAGDLEISLLNTSNANGVTSVLSELHVCKDAQGAAAACTVPYNAAILGSARHLGEPADGVWRITVKDLATGDQATFQGWSLKFYGH